MNFKDFYKATFDSETRTYLDSPTFRGFPLGGIGNGGISLFADGDFSECRTNHSWNVPVRDLRGSFFAIRTKDGKGRIRAKLLRRTHHHSKEFSAENVAHTEFRGRVPFFELQYKDNDLPVDVTLGGFSPLIPHNVKDSSLPAVLFDVDVANPTDRSVDVSVLFSWQNVLGITGTACHAMYRKHAFRCNHSKRNYAVEADGDLEGVKFCIDKDFEVSDPRRRGIGRYLIFTEDREKADITTCLSWDQKEEVPGFWKEFVEQGRVRTPYNPDARPSAEKIKGKSGAVCVKMSLGPAESVRLPFYLCWFMPYYVLEKEALKKFLTRRHDGIDHGVFAANFFNSVEELAAYLLKEKDRLREESLELHRILEDPDISCLPGWLVDVILNSADSMATNSVLTKDGDYFMIEGMGWTLSPFNCATHFSHQTWLFGALTGTLDQRLCSHIYSSVFFPKLDRSELVTFRDLAEKGKVPHGNGGAEIALKDADTPYSKPIPWINDGQSDWSDLNASLIVQLGKLIKMTRDRNLLQESWPAMMEMSEYLKSLVRDNVPEACSTYDVFVYKPCFLYAATLYAAANYMLADLAGHVPPEVDPDASERGKAFLSQARATCETLNDTLWNRDKGYYRVCQSKETIFQGGLAGDWIARLSGLQPVVLPDRARSHAAWQDRVLVEPARKERLVSGHFVGKPLPWNEATPEGKKVRLKMFHRLHLDINYIYQVISHQALEAVYLGRVEEGLKCIRMIYDKVYEEGYPWDMSLFGMPGFVYMTHPVIWGFLYAMTGAAVDMLTGTLHLSPKTFPGMDELRMPVFFPLFWLAVEYNDSTKSGRVRVIKVMDGEECPRGPAAHPRQEGGMLLKKLVLTRPDDTVKEMDLNGFKLEEGRSFDYSL